MKRLLLFYQFFIFISAFAQTDKQVFNGTVILKNGIYTTYREVLDNSPKYPDCRLKITKERMSPGYYQYLDPEQNLHDYQGALFAIVDHDIFYVLHADMFCKVLIREAVSLINEEMNYMIYQTGYTVTEDHVYMVDFRNGKILKFKPDNLKEVLVRDSLLYNEFIKLSPSRQKKSLYPYLIKYNQRNPILMNER